MAEVDKTQRLQSMLETIAGKGHVYFQPPSTIKMNYPCIVYSRNDITDKRANNHRYISNVSYSITSIDYDPDSEFIDKILELPMCGYDRSFSSDGLNHDVFTIYI